MGRKISQQVATPFQITQHSSFISFLILDTAPGICAPLYICDLSHVYLTKTLGFEIDRASSLDENRAI
jgi:hypothetical protein